MSEEKKEATEAQAAPEADQGKATTVAITEGLGGVLAVKAGMTQVYDKDGNVSAVTVLDLQPNVVTQIKSKDKDGYVGVQVGLSEKKEKAANKAEQGHAKKAGAKGFYSYQEFRLPDDAKLEGLTLGSVLSCDFKEGDRLDLCSMSKGKGFQGVIKRWHFGGGPASHGASVVHRMPGSIGNRADPSKVFKGKKMAGHMGHRRVTIQNVKVVKTDLDNRLLLVNGSVPGPKGGVVRVRRAVKEL